MMRSLYSAVSGLQVHQVKMDVLANNIANVNTTGYKKGQVTFQDMLNQTIRSAQAATGSGSGNTGGANPQQIGLGVLVGTINNVHSQGAAATTGNSTDLMIQGEGYFILQDKDGNEYYSRAGVFSLDNEGNLVNSANGMLVCDSSSEAINISDYGGNISIAADGTISYIDNGGATQTAGPIGLATFTNPAGLLKVGENMYVESPATGTTDVAAPGSNRGTLIACALEMSNVDLAQEFVDMIISQRGFQANSKSIRTVDEMLQELINIKR